MILQKYQDSLRRIKNTIFTGLLTPRADQTHGLLFDGCLYPTSNQIKEKETWNIHVHSSYEKNSLHAKKISTHILVGVAKVQWNGKNEQLKDENRDTIKL